MYQMAIKAEAGKSRSQAGDLHREVHPCSVTSFSFKDLLYLQYKSERRPPFKHEGTRKKMQQFGVIGKQVS